MASIISANLGTDGIVTVTYSDGSTRKLSQDQARKENIKYLSGAPSASDQQSGGLTPQSGVTLNTVTDPTTGQTVDASSVIFTKNGPKTVVQLLTEARNDPKVLGQVRTQLVANGLLSKTTKSPSSVLNAYTQVLVGASGSKMDPTDYMLALKKSGFGQDAAATTGPSTSIYPTIKSATDLASDVTRAFQTALGRDPSADEIAQYSKDLASQLKKKENQPTVNYVNKNGVMTQTTTTGLDTIQYLTDKLKATPEFKTLRESGLESAKQKVGEAAKNNAIVLSDADLNNYAERVRNGEPISDIAATFRQIVGVSQPKNIQDLLNKGIDLITIYQPYKTAMAQTLELNPDSIQLSDPALTQAITGDKTMTSYEFQNSLRKDPRWQYTANAHDTVSSAVERILKDFGFMG